MGLPFFDIAQVYHQLSLRTLWGLSQVEAEALFKAFSSAYTQKMKFPNREQMLFFQIIDMLKFFVWYEQVKDKLDASSQNIMHQIYHYRLEKCLDLFNEFCEGASCLSQK